MAKKNSWFKWVVVLVVLAAAAGAGFYFWKQSHSEPIEYKTAKISTGDVVQVVTASGQLNPVMTVQVGSQVSGIIQKMYADFNSKVTNGQLVAQLDPSTFQANVGQADAELASAQAGLELVKLNADRAAALFKDNLLAKADYDKSIADLHQSESTVKIRQAALEKAKVDLSRASIFSTIDGIVISREVDVGQTVAASMNAPVLFNIANDLAKMQIDAMVAEADVGGVEVEQDVSFTVDAFPMRTFHGKVIQVRNSPVVTQNVVTYDTVIEVNNRDLKLKPGMTANVSIVVSQKDEVIKIPNAALRFRLPDSVAVKTNAVVAAPTATTNATASRSGSGRSGSSRSGRSGGGAPGGSRPGGMNRGERSGPKTVYLAEKKVVNGKTVIEPKPVQIKTGITDNLMTEVTDGLKEGDEVITGVIIPETEAARPAANPFGGSSRRF